MTQHIALGPGAEFDAVRRMLTTWGPLARGIGDDAAVIDVPMGSRLLVSTDSCIEGVHFRRPWLTSEEIGWRATVAALSDLAAMGGDVIGILLALTLPRSWHGDLEAIATGVGGACERYGAMIAGGDVTDGDHLALNITALGHAASPLSRRGARPGDTLYVTGQLGGPGSALTAWERGHAPKPAARQRFARPEARLAAGRWLAAQGVHAAIDLSDGLAGDLAHLAAASGVRCVLELGAVPCQSGVGPRDAVASGEEYELLVAAPTLDCPAFRLAQGGLTLTAVGRVEDARAGGGGQVVVEEGGQPIARPRSHDHFAER